MLNNKQLNGLIVINVLYFERLLYGKTLSHPTTPPPPHLLTKKNKNHCHYP